MPKWTVRVDDEQIAEWFREFCEINGITIQGALHAFIASAAHWQGANDHHPVAEWPPTPADRWGRLVALARQFDAQRRKKLHDP